MLFRIVKWVSILIVVLVVLSQVAIIVVALVKSDEKKAQAEDKVEVKLPVQRR